MIRTKSFIAFALVFALAPAAYCQEKKLTDQQKRGHELFVNSQKGRPCATCHALAGEGTAVGPDLTNLAGAATPAGLRVAILSTQTVYVVALQSGGKTYPAMKGKEEGGTTEYWDLSKMPPQMKKVKASEIESVANNSQWKHPPESTGYSDSELEDVISYLRFVARGESKPVKFK